MIIIAQHSPVAGPWERRNRSLKKIIRLPVSRLFLNYGSKFFSFIKMMLLISISFL